jgi:hypothetical protein
MTNSGYCLKCEILFEDAYNGMEHVRENSDHPVHFFNASGKDTAITMGVPPSVVQAVIRKDEDRAKKEALEGIGDSHSH